MLTQGGGGGRGRRMDDVILRPFQSYQDNERLLMKGCVKWNPLRLRLRLEQGSNLGLLDQ